MDSRQQYKVIGVMSGTSLDGVDLAYCTFSQDESWTFVVKHAETIRYTSGWQKKLSQAHTLGAEALQALNVEYGNYIGKLCREFMLRHRLKKVDFIASHGHTIFHQPAKGFTFQLGNGNAIHAASDLPVIYDFRSLDVARGGQGAPLVPVGDKFLFGMYNACLNLGGVANISMERKSKREAFDICFVNMGLNYLAAKAGKPYDRNGALAVKGEVNATLLTKLDKVYAKIKQSRPSLGREFFEKHIQPLLDQESTSLHDRLRTFTESAAKEITHALAGLEKNSSVLCTGGGVFNSFLLYRMVDYCDDGVSLIMPEPEIIKFKEALIFAFLGVLRIEGKVNCFKSVTGASRDSSGGVMVGF
jgi:anhydro-N-acetylmuramic acid kinase